MFVREFLALAALIVGLALLGYAFCRWIMKKAGIQPLEGPFWKVTRTTYTGPLCSPERGARTGFDRQKWMWYAVPKKCTVLCVEAVVTSGRATLEIYGDQGLLRTWESWQDPAFTVDLRGVKRVRYRGHTERFTGSISCSMRKLPPAV